MDGLRALIISVALGLGAAAPGAAMAQDVGVVQSDILVLDPESLFERTQLGRAINAELQQEREALIAQNRALEAELEAEELALTQQRTDSTPEEFRALADAFDEKVQKIRQDSERRVRQHERNREIAPVEFMRRVEPILTELMREAGAAVVLDRRSVIYRSDVVDITDTAIQRIDASIGASPGTAPQSPPVE